MQQEHTVYIKRDHIRVVSHQSKSENVLDQALKIGIA